MDGGMDERRSSELKKYVYILFVHNRRQYRIHDIAALSYSSLTALSCSVQAVAHRVN
jgi:hypothetical protein